MRRNGIKMVNRNQTISDTRLQAVDVSGFKAADLEISNVEVSDGYVLSTNENPSVLMNSRAEHFGVDDLTADSLTFKNGVVNAVEVGYSSFENAEISDSMIDRFNVYESDLTGAKILDNEMISDGSFESAHMMGVEIRGNRFDDVSFSNLDLDGSIITGNRFDDCDFSEAMGFGDSEFHGNHFKGTCFRFTQATPGDFPDDNTFEKCMFRFNGVDAYYSRNEHGRTADLSIVPKTSETRNDTTPMFTVHSTQGDGWRSLSEMENDINEWTRSYNEDGSDSDKALRLMSDPGTLAEFVDFVNGTWNATDIPATVDSIEFDSIDFGF